MGHMEVLRVECLHMEPHPDLQDKCRERLDTQELHIRRLTCTQVHTI